MNMGILSRIFKRRKSMNGAIVGIENRDNPIIGSVKNYIKMDNSGALLVIGDWGCGKTYFFKNTLAEELKREGRMLVMVSLFGIHELKEIPERLLYAYLNSSGGKNNNGKWIENLKNIADSIPKIKEYINIDKLFLGRGLYSFIPKDRIVICFDDLERLIKSITINEVLGTINDLVENYGFKVIVIANEGFVNQSKDKTELVFKEKVIEKTIAFTPDTLSIFNKLVKSYNNEGFTGYMARPEIQSTINPSAGLSLLSSKYKKNILNIRILKFAIKHFYPVFQYYEDKECEHKDIKLQSYWDFILAISIEYKINNISFEDNRTLDNQYSNVIDFDFDNHTEAEQLFDEDLDDTSTDNENKQQADASYSKKFYEKYFVKREKYPIFHKELYNYVTGGIEPNYEELNTNMDSALKNYIHVENPAHTLLSQLLMGIWRFTNEDIANKLRELHLYVKKGELEDYVSYMNAYTYLYGYKEILPISKDDLDTDIRTGIDIFNKTIKNVSFLTKQGLQMVKSGIPECTQWVFSYIQTELSSIEEEQFRDEVTILERNFEENFDEFMTCFIIQPSSTPKYYSTPILHHLRKECIERKVHNLEPNDVITLQHLIEERYIKNSGVDLYNEEKIFLDRLKAAIDGLELRNDKMSDVMIARQLKPTINKLFTE